MFIEWKRKPLHLAFIQNTNWTLYTTTRRQKNIFFISIFDRINRMESTLDTVYWLSKRCSYYSNIENEYRVDLFEITNSLQYNTHWARVISFYAFVCSIVDFDSIRNPRAVHIWIVFFKYSFCCCLFLYSVSLISSYILHIAYFPFSISRNQCVSHESSYLL